jgi:hypothetical protein
MWDGRPTAYSVASLNQVLDDACSRFRMHDPATWPRQAGLLADGHWQRFKEWTDELTGGRGAP